MRLSPILRLASVLQVASRRRTSILCKPLSAALLPLLTESQRLTYYLTALS